MNQKIDRHMANKLSQGDCVPIGCRNYTVTPFLHSNHHPNQFSSSIDTPHHPENVGGCWLRVILLSSSIRFSNRNRLYDRCKCGHGRRLHSAIDQTSFRYTYMRNLNTTLTSITASTPIVPTNIYCLVSIPSQPSILLTAQKEQHQNPQPPPHLQKQL
jgi:hypothetical protein